MKILIIEDDIGITELIKEEVEAVGFETFSAQTADSAIKWLTENTPHLMILDYSLPDMNGKEFMTALQNRDLPIPPFIVSTGQGDERIAVEMMKLGAKDYLIKNNHFLEILPEVIKRVSKEIRNEDKLKQAEEMLRLSNLKNIAMISNISDVIGIIGADGLMKYKSPNIEKWFGWEPKDLVGTDCFFNVHPEDLERIQKILTILLEKDNSSRTMELKYKCKDGGYKPINLTATNLTNDPNINGVLINYHDITKRKQAEEKNLQQQYYLKKSQELGKIGTWDLDLKENILCWTDENCRIFGVPPGSVVNYEIFLSKIHPDDREYVSREWMAGVAGKPYDIEHRLLIDGVTTWVREKADVTFDENGVAVSAIGFTQDITERKQAYEALRDRELLFSQMFEQSIVSTQLLDMDGNTIRVNPTFCKLFGVTKEDMMHYKIFEDIAIKESDAYAPLMDVFENKNAQRWHNQFNIAQASKSSGVKTTKPEIVFLENLSYPILDSKENLQYVVIQHYNITGRMQAEEALRKSEAIKNTMVSNIGDVIVIIDKNGINQYKSPNITKLFGWKPEELVGQSTWDNVHSDDLEHAKSFIDSLLEEPNKTGTTELRYKREDGSYCYIQFTGVNLFHDPDIIGILGNYHDITERKKTEDALLRQERLSAIGELASGVAHDFNNALQIILGGVEMALVSEEPEELSQYLESIKHSAGDAASRVRQLQRFSQKSNKQKKSVSINFNDIVDDVIKEAKLFINQYQERGIHIEVKSDYHSRSNIEGVEGELRACLFNLIKNSAEAMPKGGTITISTDEYEDKLYVSVTDTGVGMDNETQKKIFQPFYSTKGFEPGRGLGMAQVYSTIRDHNGNIYIKESEIGKGSVIEFTLPLSQKKSILVKKEKDYAGTANILWVDDEGMIRTLGKKMLKMLGHTADVAANGSEALEFLAKGNKYDLIITDIGMPGLSGWQLAEEIGNQGYSTRIAVLTGWGSEVSQEQKNRYNVGYVLGKPVEIKELKALIGEVLQMKNISGKEDVNK